MSSPSDFKWSLLGEFDSTRHRHRNRRRGRRNAGAPSSRKQVWADSCPQLGTSVSAGEQILLAVNGHFHVRQWAVFHVRRSSALVNERVTRWRAGGGFPHEAEGRWTMTCQGPWAADWRLSWQSRSQCARLPTCPRGRLPARDRMPSETSTANTSRSRGGVDICAQTWRADRSRTGDWSARGTNPLTTSRTDRWCRGPQQIFAKIPGLGTTFKMLTKVWPLGRGTVSVSGNDIVVEEVARLRDSPVRFWHTADSGGRLTDGSQTQRSLREGGSSYSVSAAPHPVNPGVLGVCRHEKPNRLSPEGARAAAAARATGEPLRELAAAFGLRIGGVDWRWTVDCAHVSPTGRGRLTNSRHDGLVTAMASTSREPRVGARPRRREDPPILCVSGVGCVSLKT